MEPLSNTDKKIKEIAGFLGVLQSLTWIILSIICIYYHFKYDGNILSIRSYMDVVQYLIGNVFLTGNLHFGGQSLSNNEFLVISVIYLFLDVIWLFVSINVLRRKFNNSLTTAIKRWSIITALVCLLDLITTVVLGTDYHKCTRKGDIIEKIVIQAFCANALLPILVIAAKGFVLWIVNFVFIIVMRKMTNRVKIITYNQTTTTTYTYPPVQNPSIPYTGSQIPVPQSQPQPQNFAESSERSSQNPSAPPNHENWNVASLPSNYQNWVGQANWRLENPKQNYQPY